MPKKTVKRLLASELEILDALWGTEGLSIVEVQRKLPASAGYTTVQTRLNRMVAKNLTKRSKSKPAKYTAAINQEDVASQDLNTLLSKVSQGRVMPLVVQLVQQCSLTQSEVNELRKLIDEAERQIQAN